MKRTKCFPWTPAPIVGLLGLLLFSALPVKANAMCVCLTCIFTDKHNFVISSSAMSPFLKIDDCVIAEIARGPEMDLEPGEVVVFREDDGPVFIFRYIAGPGQTVQMQDGVLVLDGEAVDRQVAEPFRMMNVRGGPANSLPGCPPLTPVGEECAIDAYTETLPTGATFQVLDQGDMGLDNSLMFEVPDDHIFVLGDNRDNALDSRVAKRIGGPGFVPIENVIGRYLYHN